MYLHLSYKKYLFQLYGYCIYLLYIVRKYDIMRLLKNNILLIEF